MAMSKQDREKAIVIALSHPLRVQILEKLAANTNGGLSPSDMAKSLGAPLGNVSYHVRCLADAGVLKLVNSVPRRGAIEHFYVRAGNIVDQKIGDVLELIKD
jgi:DNA-binding transcriptional ArsR family regulator